MPTYEEIVGELAAQGLGDLDPYGGAVAGPPGTLANQSAYDPWQRAAAAVRFGAKPLGGRQEGVATTLPQEILAAPVRAAAGFTKAAFDRAAEEHGYAPQISTDYDPRRVAAYGGAETGLNTVGFGTPFSQAGALGSAGGKAVMGQLAEQAPPFYSAVERAVQGAKQNVAPGQQWAGYLRNQPGVKPEEIEALKLGQLFEQSGAISKQSVLDQIAANRVNVGEVVKGDLTRIQELERQRGEARRLFQETSDPAAGTRLNELNTELVNASVAESPKFASYTLPGGENYREMLLTLPGRGSPLALEMRGFKDILGEFKTVDDVAVAQRHNANFRETTKGMAPEEVFKAIQEAKTLPNQEPFRTSHFDEPNILAHVRYNDRVIDGKKTLFVEEVQSDWHQAGKKRGYRDVNAPTLRTEKIPDTEFYRVMAVPANGGPPIEWSTGRLSHREAMQVAEDAKSAIKVPDAPFKTTWPELAMKRIIREAAEKGYDKVAWTPGSVQAARYDLSKHVDKINLVPDASGQFRIDAFKGSNKVIEHFAKTEDEVADVIGKEAAKKLFENRNQHGAATLAGLDLQVGGEGMKGFYDEILPSTVNKLVKKHGGRVQQAEMFEGSPDKWVPFQRDDGIWQLRNAEDGFEASLIYPTREAALADMRKGPKHGVHTFDITPSLREQAMKGFPLFTAGGVAATGALGELARRDQYQRQ